MSKKTNKNSNAKNKLATPMRNTRVELHDDIIQEVYRAKGFLCAIEETLMGFSISAKRLGEKSLTEDIDTALGLAIRNRVKLMSSNLLDLAQRIQITKNYICEDRQMVEEMFEVLFVDPSE